MRSPGRPEPSRAVQREFWRLIATGITSAEAALKVGVSVPVGARWFRPGVNAPEFHHCGNGTFTETGAFHDLRHRMTKWLYLT